ncbi:MAG TPA: ADP-ribosyl-(dinitrogen reductase) hydrolase [Betaproteobacteria bacterium]|nr:ADP-ribosyl-(dinitrogen reductase) hydrolase [Betaproteobacteria bacterium]
MAGKTPPVTESEIVQYFANRTGKDLIDTRAQHLTNPLTRWFIAETDFGRNLKVAYMPTNSGIVIKSAYDPNATELRIYKKVGLP